MGSAPSCPGSAMLIICVSQSARPLPAYGIAARWELRWAHVPMPGVPQTRTAQAQTMREQLWRAVVLRRQQQSAPGPFALSASSSDAWSMDGDARGLVGSDVGRMGGLEAGKGAGGGSDGESSDASTSSDSSGETRVGRLEEAGLESSLHCPCSSAWMHSMPDLMPAGPPQAVYEMQTHLGAIARTLI